MTLSFKWCSKSTQTFAGRRRVERAVDKLNRGEMSPETGWH